MVFLGLIIVLVHVDAKLNFFNGDGFLVLLGLALFLFLLVQKFPVIHDAAHRRLRGGRNLDQIQIFEPGHLERFKRRQDANLIAFVVNYADFAGANTLISANKTFIDTKPPNTPRRVRSKNYSMVAMRYPTGIPISSVSPRSVIFARSHWLGLCFPCTFNLR